MYNRYHLTIVCMMIVLVLSVTNAFSANRAEVISISPFAGTYLFDSEQELKNKAVFGLAVGYNFSERWTGEVSFSGIKTEEDTPGGQDVDVTQGRLDILYHFLPEETFVPFIAAGAGVARVSPDGLGNDTDVLLVYGAGFKFFLNEQVALRLELRHLMDFNNEDSQRENDVFHNLSAVGGLSFQFGGAKSSPEVYETQAGEAFGDEAAVQSPPVVEALAVPPAVTAAEDSDNDGVIDVLDRCPVTPYGTSVNAEGCPATIKFVDSDDDGVSDALDACPDTPVDVVVDIRGCPLADTDGDGISDINDNCQQTEAQHPVDEFGCPKLSDKLKIGGLVIEFATSQTGFSEEAERELELLAAKVNSTPYGRLVVEGHTDSVGGENHNLKLSQDRAEKVRQALIKDFGVPVNRVVSKGYGPFEPVADNNTQAGRQQNRRVVVRYEP